MKIRRNPPDMHKVIRNKEYKDKGEDSDSDSDSKLGDDETFDLDSLLQYLNGLNAEIAAKHNAPDKGCAPGSRSTVQPFEHQQRAMATATRALNTDFKWLILADSLGLGKTVSPVHLFKYRVVVVTSYHYVAAELMRNMKFIREIDEFNAAAGGQKSPALPKPKRPNATGLFEGEVPVQVQVQATAHGGP
ncbi:hypothetical protein ACJ41O_014081 [Fusarium nematophilum]